MKRLILFISLSACASAPKDYTNTPAKEGRAQLTIYRPHRWENMLASYLVTVNGKPQNVINDKGYTTLTLPTGECEIISRHVQSKLAMRLILNAESAKSYFVKIDPDYELSVVDVIGAIGQVSTLVASTKAQMNIESGQAGFGDVVDAIQGEDLKAQMREAKNDPKKDVGYHVLMSIRDDVARAELAQCCSSKATEPPPPEAKAGDKVE
jgi:hypothetical protein